MSDFEISRSETIAAPAALVYERIIDFKRWLEWSPWEDRDPNLERTFSDPSGGVGAHYAWSGNRRAGAGEMTITSATEPREVQVALTFTKPFKAENVVTFSLVEEDGGTTVVWMLRGKNDTLAKRIFAKTFNMDKVIGSDFEQGLEAMKLLIETDVDAAAS